MMHVNNDERIYWVFDPSESEEIPESTGELSSFEKEDPGMKLNSILADEDIEPDDEMAKLLECDICGSRYFPCDFCKK